MLRTTKSAPQNCARVSTADVWFAAGDSATWRQAQETTWRQCRVLPKRSPKLTATCPSSVNQDHAVKNSDGANRVSSGKYYMAATQIERMYRKGAKY